MKAENEKLITVFIQGGVSKEGKPFIWLNCQKGRFVMQGTFAFITSEQLSEIIEADKERQKERQQKQNESGD